MSDLGRFLPLSNRPRGDESAVTSDRRGQIADVVLAAAGAITQAPPSDAPSLTTAFLTAARLGPDAAPAGSAAPTIPADSVATLTTLAERIRSGRRRTLRHLARTARAYLVLARDAQTPPHLDPAVTGAVALWASGSGPFPRRAAIAGHTVRASDDGWEFGHGPVLSAPGLQIASFLLGITDEPPRRATGPAPGTLEQ